MVSTADGDAIANLTGILFNFQSHRELSFVFLYCHPCQGKSTELLCGGFSDNTLWSLHVVLETTEGDVKSETDLPSNENV